MRLLLAQVVYLPCEGVEEGSWLWWLRGCWIAGFEILMWAALTGGAIFAMYRLWRSVSTRQVVAR